MITLSVITIITFIITSFLGWCVHYCMHQTWSLKFHTAHMNHHLTQYPPTDFLSDEYKSAGADSATIWFVIAFSPVFLMLAALMYYKILPVDMGIMILVAMSLTGTLFNYLHSQFHIKNTIWNRIPLISILFKYLQDLHYIHHVDMTKNLGIIFFWWDKLFKTFHKNS